MFPELIKIGSISIKSYGLFVAIGFILALNYAISRAKKADISKDFITNLGLYIVFSGIIGARILYVLFNWDYYKGNLLEIPQIWTGGLVLYGGFFAGFLAGLYYTIKKKVAAWKLADIIAPAFFIGLAFGRIGCFMAGCCYGKPTDIFCGVTYTNPSSLAPLGVRLHPVQLYESIFCLLLFLSMHFLLKIKKFNGEVFFISVAIYAAWRFLIEFMRADDRGALTFGLYPSQFVSLVLLPLCVYMLIYLSKREQV